MVVLMELRMERLDELMAMLEKEPGDSFLRYGVGMEYAKRGEFAKAVEAYGEVIRRDPKYVAAYFMCGRAQEGLGDVAAARKTYTEGMEMARKIGDTHAAQEIAEAIMALE